MNEELEQRVKERTVLLQRSLDTSKTLNRLLDLSLQKIYLPELLEEALKVILSIPWLVFENSGAIFLLENDQLVMAAQSGLEEPVLKTRAKLPLDRSLCGKAAHSGEVQFTSSLDVSHKIDFKGRKPHAKYCIPIKTQQKVYGVLSLYLHEGYSHDKKEEDFLIAAADILVGFLERKNAEEKVRAQRDELDTLLRIASHLNTELELDKVESIICEETCSALQMQMSAYLSYNSNTQLFHLAASSGLPEEVARAFGPLSQDDMDNLCNKLGKAGVIPDQTAVPEFPLTETLLSHGIHTCAYSLVERNGVTLGILIVGYDKTDNFRESTISTLSGIANQAASAISNAQLYNEAKNRLTQVQALRNIDLAITGSLDLRVTFQVVLDEVTRMLNSDAAAILRLEPHTGTLKYKHWRGF